MGRSRRGGERSRGAAAVEAAIIAPLLIALTLGAFEFGLLYRDANIMNQAARDGARMGSTLSRSPNYHLVTADRVAAQLRGKLPDGTIEELWIFRADRYGMPVSGNLESCTIDCYRFTWNDLSEQFDLVPGSEWSYADQQACGIPYDNDYLGVRVDGFHRWVTGILGEGRDLSASAVFRLEPVTTSEACK